MLKENPYTAQVPGEGVRRWFSDELFDLITWSATRDAVPDQFQLYYNLGKDEHYVSWNPSAGLRQGRVDPGEQKPTANRSPLLAKGTTIAISKVGQAFHERSREMDPAIARFVLARLGFQPKTDAAPRPAPAPAPVAPGGVTRAKPAGKASARPATKAPVRLAPPGLLGPKRQALPDELLKKVRLIEISTRKMVDDMMGGQYRSNFKGHGVQFSEHRQYVAGDDVRHIDWKVSARTRDPLIKKYEEERELTVFIIVDVSGSEAFGSTEKLKSEVAAEISGMLAYAAVHSGDKVGVLLFGGEVEKIVPPKKGRQHILRIIREVLGHETRTLGTDLAGALDAAGRIMKHGGVVFVISDFMAEGYEIALKRLARRHDVVAVSVGDEREFQIPEVGQILFQDPETGEEQLVDTSSYAFKKWLNDYRTMHETDTETALKGGRVESLRILTKDDYGDAVVRFFKARARRKR